MRPNSIFGLIRRLFVLRWQRLGVNARLALSIGAGVLAVGALISTSTCMFGSCMRSQGCPYSRAAMQAPAAPVEQAPVVVEEAAEEETPVHRGCRYLTR
ncbi:MAG: hypothetical protein AAGE52_17935 [Myxococcota bacterium]